MSFNINGKVALVTGGASGLGLAFVKELLRNGAKAVSIVDINSQNSSQILKEIRDEFGENSCIFIKCDVSDCTSFEGAFKQTVETFKQLDIVVNNAGLYNERVWEKVVLVNLNGCINGTLLALDKYLPQYRSDKEGVIINVASIFGIEPCSGAPLYTATKSGVLGFSRAYGDNSHYKRSNVKIIALCPGVTTTEMLKVTKEQRRDWFNPEFSDAIRKTKIQTPAHVAKNLMKVIVEGKSGSAWVVTKEEPAYEETFLERSYL